MSTILFSSFLIIRYFVSQKFLLFFVFCNLFLKMLTFFLIVVIISLYCLSLNKSTILLRKMFLCFCNLIILRLSALIIPFCIFNVLTLVYYYIVPSGYYRHNNELIEISAANLLESSYVAGILSMFSCVVITDIASSCYLKISVALTYAGSGRSVMTFRCSDRVLNG